MKHSLSFRAQDYSSSSRERKDRDDDLKSRKGKPFAKKSQDAFKNWKRQDFFVKEEGNDDAF